MNFPEPQLGRKVKEYISKALKEYMISERVISGRGIMIKQTAAGRTISAVNSSQAPDYPFKLYIDDGKLCCVEGHHYWFNEFSNSVTINTLQEGGLNSWPINAASTVYVERTYITDGSATVTLERTTDTPAMVKAGQSATIMRFIIGTCTNQGVITQRWLGGDIDESRVA